MKQAVYGITAAVVLAVAACTSQSPNEPDTESVVIRAYLYAGEPVTEIQITTTLPIGSTDSTAPPVNDATVYLIKDGVQYSLESSEGDSGFYHYYGSDLDVETGDVFRIGVDYFDKTAWGETVVPEPPGNVTCSADTVYIPEEFTPWNTDQDSSRHDITISWDAVEDGLFFVVIESLEDDPEEIEIADQFGGGFSDGRFLSQPMDRNSYRIHFMELKYYGRHRVNVYSVNQEYIDLYRSRMQDSRDLNEPLTNITGGLGVFSAFSSTARDFYVTRE